MILKEKLLLKFKEEELISLLGEYSYKQVLNEKLYLSISTIFKKISLNEFNYTFEDFKIDFKDELEPFTEKKMYYTLICKKHNMSSYSNYLGLSSYKSFENIFIKGIHNVSYFVLAFVYTLIEQEIDISMFKKKDIHFFSNHCTIYSSKEKLEIFKAKYNLPYIVCFNNRSKKWSLGFTGWVYLKIRDSLNLNFKINIEYLGYSKWF